MEEQIKKDKKWIGVFAFIFFMFLLAGGDDGFAGTMNYIPKFITPSSLGNSHLYELNTTLYLNGTFNLNNNWTINTSVLISPIPPAGTNYSLNLDDYLVSYWRFSSNYSLNTNITLDETGTNNAYCVNMTSCPIFNSTDWIGGSFEFISSSNRFFNVTDSDSLSFGNGTADKPFTLMTWVYIKTTKFRIFSKGGFLDRGEYLFSLDGSGRLYLALMDASASHNYIGRRYGVALSTNTWYHVVATYNGSQTPSSVKLYLNGVQVDN